MRDLTDRELQLVKQLTEFKGGGEPTPTIIAMARAMAAREREAAKSAPAAKMKTVRDVVAEWVSENLGFKEEVSLAIIARWLRGNMDKVADLVRQVAVTALGNAKAAWMLSAIGALVMIAGAACAQGQEVFSHETCAKVLVVSGALNVFTRFAPHSQDDSAKK